MIFIYTILIYSVKLFLQISESGKKGTRPGPEHRAGLLAMIDNLLKFHRVAHLIVKANRAIKWERC